MHRGKYLSEESIERGGMILRREPHIQGTSARPPKVT